ncbi:hypothetical protein PybrP1_003644 [[Pythium] brassicae (nom. inval.)]|nr:hypothetical protein PybrP1_003644 [[Pythium] brassicae (nom. inval.)]
MGPDRPADARDDPLLLPFMEALYDDASGFELATLDGDVVDVDEELVPLVELVSSEDNAAYAEALVATVAAPEPSPSIGSGASAAELAPPLAPAAHAGQPAWLTAMQHSGVKRSLKGNPNRARDERRHELAYLRNKVAELEAELRSIQAKRPRLAEGRDSGDVRAATAPSASPVLAAALEKILHRRSTAKDIDEFVERHQMSAPTVDATDADVFQALMRDVELLFAKVDGVFDANGLAYTETSVTSARVRSDAHSGVSLEIFANKLLPFALHATGDAVWHHFAFAKEHTPFRCYQYSSDKYMQSSDDMVVENFILKLNAKGTDANFRCKQILRRHVQQDRVVIVWRAAVEAFEFSDEPVSGVRFHEDGYIVIRRPAPWSRLCFLL